MRFGPLSFLFAVTGGWAAVRVVMLWPEEAPTSRKRGAAWRPALAEAGAAPVPETILAHPMTLPIARPGPRRIEATARAVPTQRIVFAGVPDTAAPSPQTRPPPLAVAPVQPPQPAARPASPSHRFSLSSWVIVRGSGSGGLATAGQLGGSQAGVRARYDLGSGLAIAARLSAPLRESHGKEAAVALDWRPSGALPVTFTVERRAGLDRGGRDAFAAGAFGGFDSIELPLGARLDGYAQAGVVGLKRRDLYADGAIRVERTVLGADRVRIGVGAGLWGGAQPRLSRLDAGPQIVAHAPLGPVSIRVAAEWRQRVAGNARPGSGPALSIGADF